ncbi:MAG TPA: DUF1638 domain-containing protein [Methanomassiliicoccales archaeon]|nr:DUF1638 domain-containing protein [Methanomassiliicoccales archaeon]
MRIGIVACETFRREIDAITNGDEDIVHKEYLEFGLHEYPEELKRTVISKVNALHDKVDAVFLGYGVCQSLKDVKRFFTVPTVMIDADDCVGALITQAEYERERKKCAGTWFATPAFCEMGEDWFRDRMIKDMGEEAVRQLDEQGYGVDWFLHKMFDGYSRALFIDTGVGEREYFEALSRKFAAKLNLRHECRLGTLDVLRTELARTKDLARTVS